MKKLISALLITAMVLSGTVFALAAGQFTDVPETHTHFSAIEELAENSIINGYPDGNFNPEGSITRAEFTAILCRAIIGKNAVIGFMGQPTNFSDVPPSHWASGYINAAYNHGLVNGMGDGTFAPEASVTFAQAIKMVVSVLDFPQEDIDYHGGYPDGYLFYAKAFGFDYNVDTTVGAAINRGSVAQIIYNFAHVLIGHETDRITEAVPVPSPEQSPEPDKKAPGKYIPPSEQAVYDVIMALKTQYPDGMTWNNANTYTSKYIIGNGCAALAWIFSDAAFGFDAPMRKHTDFTNICIGDMIRINNNTHTVIVLEVKSNSVVVVEGNYDNSILWGREITIASLSSGYITTRYPEGYIHGSN